MLSFTKQYSVKELCRNPKLPWMALQGWMSEMEGSSFTGRGGGTSKEKQVWKWMKISDYSTSTYVYLSL